MQSANSEFLNLMQVMEWSQADTARQLGISSGAVNQIVKGKTSPSQQTMRIFRMLVLQEKPGAFTYQTGPSGEIENLEFREGPAKQLNRQWQREVVEDLEQLEPEDRENFLALIRKFAVKRETGSGKKRL